MHVPTPLCHISVCVFLLSRRLLKSGLLMNKLTRYYEITKLLTSLLVSSAVCTRTTSRCISVCYCWTCSSISVFRTRSLNVSYQVRVKARAIRGLCCSLLLRAFRSGLSLWLHCVVGIIHITHRWCSVMSCQACILIRLSVYSLWRSLL